MKVTIKTLSQKQYPLEVEPSESVFSMKQRMMSLESSIQDPQLTTLIYQGKILKDESTVEENELKENGFLVILVNKPSKATPTKKEEAKSNTTASQDPIATKTTEKPSEKAGSSRTTENVQTTSTSGTGDSTFVIGPGLENIVLHLMEMGNFERDLVVKALRAAYNNPDRAAEFLFSGNIPQVPEAGLLPEDHPGLHQAHLRGALPRDFNENSPLAFLRQDPQFQQLRTVILQNPSMAQPILQQIGAANPRLLQLINENQEDFLALLEEGFQDLGMEFVPGDEHEIDDDDGQDISVDPSDLGHPSLEGTDVTAPSVPQGVPGSVVAGQSGSAATGAPMTQYIQVSPDEKEAIDRLVSLGFERSRVIEAYFACEKNETLAANFLFDHLQDE